VSARALRSVNSDTIAASKHRGVSRGVWSMHLKPPTVPPAATAAFQAAIGPRVLPGAYTVKLTRGDKVYTSQLNVALDPRAKYTIEDRRAQFDLVNRLAADLNHMSWAVDAILQVRDNATAQKKTDLAEAADKIRAKIVATKEGGAITGEERLREFLTGLYGDVNGYDGRPTAQQVARADSLTHELEDVIKEFRDLAAKYNMPVMSEETWKSAHQ